MSRSTREVSAHAADFLKENPGPEEIARFLERVQAAAKGEKKIAQSAAFDRFFYPALKQVKTKEDFAAWLTEKQQAGQSVTQPEVSEPEAAQPGPATPSSRAATSARPPQAPLLTRIRMV